ncbi:hypothetical protein GUJ93_ZPchr0014g46668 [Zizania palustris]|uniref:Subtilisin-like protease fibronectin type-III domain-containing protein n=1 Tax=Zizania palustris TaxID=103762 RepID=A0A8J5TG77_ZIZPA|nr:hypothetical protein GUJ93_ZPchr0014g46668 [Zizania palustris]
MQANDEMARRLKLAEFSWPLKTFTKNSSMRCSHTFSSASDLNYPAISVVFADQPSKPLTVRRTVTNVGPPSSTYHIKVTHSHSPKAFVLHFKHMCTDLWDSKSDISVGSSTMELLKKNAIKLHNKPSFIPQRINAYSNCPVVD